MFSASPVILHNQALRWLTYSALVRFFYTITHEDTVHTQRLSGSFTQSDINKPYIHSGSQVLLHNRTSRHLTYSALVRFFYTIAHQDTSYTQYQSGSFTESDIKAPYMLSASPALLHNQTLRQLTYSALGRFFYTITHQDTLYTQC